MITHLNEHFIFATPALDDDKYFSRAVVYISEHNDQGAKGFIVNQPFDINLGEVLKQLDVSVLENEFSNQPVFLGGPVDQDVGSVLYSLDKKLKPDSKLHISTAMQDLVDIVDDGNSNFIMILGYATWEPGQLEAELIDNSWLVAPVDSRIVFSTPIAERWRATAKLIGVTNLHLSDRSGNA